MKKKITNTLILLGIVGAIGSGAAFTSAYLINGDPVADCNIDIKITVASFLESLVLDM